MRTNEPEAENIDSVYYKDGANKRLAMSAMVRARRRMFDLFMREMKPDKMTKILDIGVSDDENQGANFLEKNYPFQQNITCAGIGQGCAVVNSYPKITFKKIEPNQRLPFESGEFDIAYSNAVLEHVGGPQNRARFISEHLRVARSAFLTVPNRWFPIEHHTGLPLLHYSPTLFRRLLSNSRYSYWAQPEHLDFIDIRIIIREWSAATMPKIVLTGIPLGPLSSNLAIIARQPVS